MLATLPEAQPAKAEPPLSRLIVSAQPANKAARRKGTWTAAMAPSAGAIDETLVMISPQDFKNQKDALDEALETLRTRSSCKSFAKADLQRKRHAAEISLHNPRSLMTSDESTTLPWRSS